MNDMISSNEEIGLKIKLLRKKQGLTQQDLAKKINKTESSIRKYEKGLVAIPLPVLKDIAGILGVKLKALVLAGPSTDEAYELSKEHEEYMQKAIEADSFGDSDKTFLTEQLELSTLYNKYFVKLLSWRLKDINSLSDFFELTLRWYMAIDIYKTLPDEDIEELNILFERLFTLKEREYEYFKLFEREYGTTNDYGKVLSRDRLSKKDKDGN